MVAAPEISAQANYTHLSGLRYISLYFYEVTLYK